MSLYTADGKINTTTVDGSAYTGLHAADGGINIVEDDVTYTGQYHPCGAIRVNTDDGETYYDASGAAYTNHLLGPGR